MLKSEPIVNLSTAQLIGYEVLTQLPSEHDSEVFFQQLMHDSEVFFQQFFSS
ncbi:putative diguanylate cyclase [Salmonella enterica subsp. enterica serovar Baildon str. R6-199]|nr:putative diguanylate cyclase [Salmonella enterica subsp. enterica serovar Baildon str. R6-199]